MFLNTANIIKRKVGVGLVNRRNLVKNYHQYFYKIDEKSKNIVENIGEITLNGESSTGMYVTKG